MRHLPYFRLDLILMMNYNKGFWWVFKYSTQFFSCRYNFPHHCSTHAVTQELKTGRGVTFDGVLESLIAVCSDVDLIYYVFVECLPACAY